MQTSPLPLGYGAIYIKHSKNLRKCPDQLCNKSTFPLVVGLPGRAGGVVLAAEDHQGYEGDEVGEGVEKFRREEPEPFNIDDIHRQGGGCTEEEGSPQDAQGEPAPKGDRRQGDKALSVDREYRKLDVLGQHDAAPGKSRQGAGNKHRNVPDLQYFDSRGGQGLGMFPAGPQPQAPGPFVQHKPAQAQNDQGDPDRRIDTAEAGHHAHPGVHGPVHAEEELAEKDRDAVGKEVDPRAGDHLVGPQGDGRKGVDQGKEAAHYGGEEERQGDGLEM